MIKTLINSLTGVPIGIYTQTENTVLVDPDPGFEFIDGRPTDLESEYWDGTSWVVYPPKPGKTYTWSGTAWEDLRPLANIKISARQRMANAWNTEKAKGVTFGTKTAPTDVDSWTRYLAIKEMAADGGWVDVPIPLADGTFELMTQAKMITLWGALKTMERTLLNKLKDKIELINAATTKEEVEAVTW